MVLPRVTTFRSVLKPQSIRASINLTRTRAWQRTGRRGYASSGGHEPKRAGGDLPWIIGSIAVTLPTCAYLLQPSNDKGHGHGGHEEHEEHAEVSQEGEDLKEEVTEESKDESKAGGGGDEGDSNDAKPEESEEKDPQPEATDDSNTDNSDIGAGKSEGSSGDDEKKQGKAEPYKGDDEPHEVESGGNVEGVQFKGATSGGEGAKEGKMEQDDTRKHIPDAKGGAKKRIESDYGLKQAETDKIKDTDPTGTVDKDKAAPAKPPTSHNETSGKQEGLTNTDTKHSTDITNNPDKSTKGEGSPETSKSKGTVDPTRPQK